MNKLISKLRPTPSMVVSVLSAVVALGSAGYAATGGNFLLGIKNLAANTTTLKATTGGYGLIVQNTAGPPLALIGKVTKPPLSVNSAVKVKNLNADYIDGLDSSAFVPAATSIGHSITIPFALAAGASSPPITLPTNGPMMVIGATTTANVDSVGEVTLLPRGDDLDWTGLESGVSAITPSDITSGYTASSGTHIFYTDVNHLVDVRSNTSTSIIVHNGSGSGRGGFVTFIY